MFNKFLHYCLLIFIFDPLLLSMLSQVARSLPTLSLSILIKRQIKERKKYRGGKNETFNIYRKMYKSNIYNTVFKQREREGRDDLRNCHERIVSAIISKVLSLSAKANIKVDIPKPFQYADVFFLSCLFSYRQLFIRHCSSFSWFINCEWNSLVQWYS